MFILFTSDAEKSFRHAVGPLEQREPPERQNEEQLKGQQLHLGFKQTVLGRELKIDKKSYLSLTNAAKC